MDPGRYSTIKVETRESKGLTLHEGHQLFAAPEEHEVALLAADIKRRGLQHLIEITPDGRVIAGRKRLMALLQLRHTEVKCRVRYDLAVKGEEAIQQHLIADNLMRQDLKPLEKARAYLAYRAMVDGKAAWSAGDKRDQLAEKFGRSVRTLDRYVRILRTPRSVQDAFERNEITLKEGNKIAGLMPDEQKAIDEALAAGIAVREVLADYLPLKPTKSSNTEKQSPTPESVFRDLTTVVGRLLNAAKASRFPATATHARVLDQVIFKLSAVRDAFQDES